MNKCPYVLKRFHALKKELQIFLLTIFQVPGMDLPEARDMFSIEITLSKNTKLYTLQPWLRRRSEGFSLTRLRKRALDALRLAPKLIFSCKRTTGTVMAIQFVLESLL